LVGIVLGTSIAAILTSVWYLPLLTARVFNRRWLELVREDAFPILLVAVCLVPPTYFAQILGTSTGGFLGAMLAGGLTGAAGLGLLWLLAFDRITRYRLQQMLAKGNRHLFGPVSAAP
jgi:hypothetical protein